MRKNLLTFLFVLTIGVFGIGLTNAIASSGSLGNLPNTNSNIDKTAKLSRTFQLTKNFDERIAKFKEVCGTGNLCDLMIDVSVQVADDMIAACNYAETSSACLNAQTYLQQVMDFTLDVCSSDGPTSKRIVKDKTLRFIDHLNQVKNGEVVGE